MAIGREALLVLLPLACMVLTAASNTTTDLSLLLAFKKSFENGDSVMSDWTGSTPCAGQGWTGVKCEAGHVISV